MISDFENYYSKTKSGQHFACSLRFTSLIQHSCLPTPTAGGHTLLLHEHLVALTDSIHRIYTLSTLQMALAKQDSFPKDTENSLLAAF